VNSDDQLLSVSVILHALFSVFKLITSELVFKLRPSHEFIQKIFVLAIPRRITNE
jgi:hypothetical protein